MFAIFHHPKKEPLSSPDPLGQRSIPHTQDQPSRFNWHPTTAIPDLPTQPYPTPALPNDWEDVPPAFSIRATILTFAIALFCCTLAVGVWLFSINPLLLVPPPAPQAPIASLDVSTHAFIAEVFNGRVVVMDTPTDHPEKEGIFLCQPASTDQTIQLQEADVNHDGAQDVIVYTQNDQKRTVLYAHGKSFVEGK